MSKPISPKDITSHKAENFPPEVFEAWNQLISDNFDGTSAVIGLSEARDHIRNYLSLRCVEFKEVYMSIEDVYRKFGWEVEYDRPGFNESYEPFYEFSEKDE